MNEDLKLPPCNYSAGATVFASFALDGSSFGSITSSSGTGKVANVSDTDVTSYEVFVAIGRPGEPILGTRSGSAPEPGGVSVSDATFWFSFPFFFFFFFGSSTFHHPYCWCCCVV